MITPMMTTTMARPTKVSGLPDAPPLIFAKSFTVFLFPTAASPRSATALGLTEQTPPAIRPTGPEPSSYQFRGD
jgi:hypothetical protein